MYKDLIGIPFINNGRDINKGFDCYGLVMEVYRRNGIELPEFYADCTDITSIHDIYVKEKQTPKWIMLNRKDITAPCLVAIRFNSTVVNHTGVYIGNGKFIHTRLKVGVNIDRIDSPAWRNLIEGFYKFGG